MSRRRLPTDAELDELADRFLALRIRGLTGCPFGRYAAMPPAFRARLEERAAAEREARADRVRRATTVYDTGRGRVALPVN